MTNNCKKALIVVDVQNDFINGSMVIPGALNLIPSINHVVKYWVEMDIGPIIFTIDWHPENHCSFINAQKNSNNSFLENSDHNKEEKLKYTARDSSSKKWPIHCVQNTYGAMLSEELLVPANSFIIPKGTCTDVDSYSAFFDNSGSSSTQLMMLLSKLNIQHLFICGLVLDICVGYTCLDACLLGFQTSLIKYCTVSLSNHGQQNMLVQLNKKYNFEIISNQVLLYQKLEKEKEIKTNQMKKN